MKGNNSNIFEGNDLVLMFGDEAGNFTVVARAENHKFKNDKGLDNYDFGSGSLLISCENLTTFNEGVVNLETLYKKMREKTRVIVTLSKAVSYFAHSNGVENIDFNIASPGNTDFQINMISRVGAFIITSVEVTDLGKFSVSFQESGIIVK